nr:MarR family transcriptional regulator [Conexibacter arvalis]
MLSEAERSYVDQVGRYFARQYAVAPVVGRVVGWLLICEPPRQTAAAIAAGLGISRSAVGSAVTTLESWGMAERTRPPGERADRVAIRSGFGVDSLEASAEYAALAALARTGLELLADAPPARRARLAELAAFGEFLTERMPTIAAEWRVRRDELRAAGVLPGPD